VWTHSRPHGHAPASTRTRLCIRTDIGPSARTRSSPCPRPPSKPLGCPARMGCCIRADARKIFYFIFKFIYFGCWLLEKRGKNCSIFGFQSPRSPRSLRSPRSPSSPGFAGETVRRRRFFRPNSPSHPSKLYSSLGLLNSKVPKPFFPFTPRLIDVDGF
jgi:hypothetical protein